MVFRGHVVNGAVVFDEPLPLPDGTPVRVESLEAPAFWQSLSIDELARQQSVRSFAMVEEAPEGWPSDELDDGFEVALRRWRDEEMDDPR